jgi:hypothetical protein
MALRFPRFILSVCFILTLLSILIPTRSAQAFNDPFSAGKLPLLKEFIHQVKNGQADDLRGIYIPEILAARIVQQPDGKNEFVSSWDNIATQFDPAADLGSTGLLAHNYLAGKSFPHVQKNNIFHLVYGDGRTSAFIVTEILQFKALEPANVSGNFINLENGDSLTASELFLKAYNRPDHVILQTCISASNNSSWGRLFIIAEPYSD